MQLKRQHKHSKFSGNLDQILIQLIHMESSFWPYWFWKILHASLCLTRKLQEVRIVRRHIMQELNWNNNPALFPKLLLLSTVSFTKIWKQASSVTRQYVHNNKGIFCFLKSLWQSLWGAAVSLNSLLAQLALILSSDRFSYDNLTGKVQRDIKSEVVMAVYQWQTQAEHHEICFWFYTD